MKSENVSYDIEVLGTLWMGGIAAKELTLSEIESPIADPLDIIATVMGGNVADFASVVDYQAYEVRTSEVIENPDGETRIHIKTVITRKIKSWSKETSESKWSECMYGEV